MVPGFMDQHDGCEERDKADASESSGRRPRIGFFDRQPS